MSEVVAPVGAAGFVSLGLDPRIVAALGYNDPTPIQKEAIPVLLQGKDLVGLAGTGTGKTAAFALPILHKLATAGTKPTGVSALVLTPTRELAVQVSKAIAVYGKPIGIEVLAVYGGTAYAEQVRTIRRGVHVVVATPGRALDLVRQGKLPLDAVKSVVLDEADEMLDMGFAEDIDAILSATPKDRQTMLFSATMPPRIEEIAQRHLRSPVRIRVAAAKPVEGEEAQVRQTAYLVRREHKLATLGRILDVERPTSAIIFCRTRSEADELTEMLGLRDFKPLALHGGLTQEQRDRVMKLFRSGVADLLVATDIAARGLDISHLSHVINFDVPPQAEAYVHRIGRVGRAGRQGVAITLAFPREQGALAQIERLTKQKIHIAPIPTGKDLKAARLERIKQTLREAVAALDVSNELRGMIGELEKEFPIKDIALAATVLLGGPTRPSDESDIPSAAPAFSSGPRSNGPPSLQHRPVDRSRFNNNAGNAGNAGDEERRRAGGRPTNKGMAKVFFGIGRDSGVATRDLVGAITNETGIPGQDLGAIDLTDRFALVEVPSDAADYVVEVMQGVRIKGRKVNVRPDRPPPRNGS